MQRRTAFLNSLAIAISLGGCSLVSAAPVVFDVSGASFSVGGGYGIDASETSSPTLLDVRFSTGGFAAQSFALDLPGSPAQTFLFGVIDFQEPSQGGGIDVSETDNLGVTASITFNGPLSGAQLLTGVASAVAGPVSDAHVDYSLTWSPLVVNFGAGGQFRISFDDLAWSDIGSKNLMATITLLSAPTSVPNNDSPNGQGPTNNEPNPQPQNNVPEPSTALLLGGALAAFWRSRRNPRSERS